MKGKKTEKQRTVPLLQSHLLYIHGTRLRTRCKDDARRIPRQIRPRYMGRTTKKKKRNCVFFFVSLSQVERLIIELINNVKAFIVTGAGRAMRELWENDEQLSPARQWDNVRCPARISMY